MVEFLDVIDPLADPADPADAFHLVVPSLPGYGFSGPTTETGWNPRRIAAAFGQLADRLGYQRYGVQGGDWGAIVSYNMAELRPERILGLHVNLMNVPPPGASPPRRRPRGLSGRVRQAGATRRSRGRARRRSATCSTTPRPGSRPGSSRSSTSGPNIQATRSPSPRTSC